MSTDTTAAPVRDSHARAWEGTGWGFAVKLVLMAAVNAIGLYVAWSAWDVEQWGVLVASLALVVVADVVYFSRRRIAGKYLYPGLVFLLVFQVFTMAYTLYVATTNYGTGHNSTQEQAVEALLIQNERPVDGAPTYPLTIVRDGEDLGFAVVDDSGQVLVGTADEPLAPADGAVVDGQVVTSLDGFEAVDLPTLLADPALQEQVLELRVPTSDDADSGSYRTREGTRATVYASSLDWAPEAGTMTDTTTGTVYTADGETGQFVAEDGSTLPVGWRVGVGFDNFTKAFTDDDYSGPFWKITAWTFAFAFLSVGLSFLLGLAIALLFDDKRLRGRAVMRTLFILPYAFPVFLSALLWRGMLNSNPDYGIINSLFFFGQRIEWLTDPFLAKVAIIGVNLWLTFPYFFLVCTGAKQSLPSELSEAARIDGAGPWRHFRAIQLPLLLISTTPLLISSFAFTFNNFVIVYMLTGGGPRFTDTSAPLGHTDILITMIYQISGVQGGSADYGLASALSILVFLVVGGISAVAFRRTRKLEEVL